MISNGSSPKSNPPMATWKKASLGGLALLATCGCNSKKAAQEGPGAAGTHATLSAQGRALVELGEGRSTLTGTALTYAEDTPAGLQRVADDLKARFLLPDSLAMENAKVAQNLWQKSTRAPTNMLADLRVLAQAGAPIEVAGKLVLAANDVYAVDGEAKGASFVVACVETYSSKVLDDGYLRTLRGLGFADADITKTLQLEKVVASGTTLDKAFGGYKWLGKVGANALAELAALKYDDGAQLGAAAEQGAKLVQRYTVPDLGPVVVRKRAKAGAWSVAVETAPYDQAKLVEGGAVTPDWNANDDAKTAWTDLKAAGAPGLLLARGSSGSVSLQNAAWAAGNMYVKPYLCESGQIPGVTLQRKTELITECVDQVKGRLKAPSQANFPSRMTAASDYKTWTNADCNQVVTSTVEAPNAFGVKMHQTWQCLYRPGTKSYDVVFKE